VSTTVLDWLRRDRQPLDVYELLGVPRLAPDRDQLLAAVKAAYRELLPYQNHRDPEVARRAMVLQMELGRAEDIVSDSGRLREHEEKVVEGLRGEYMRATREAGEVWPLERLRSWLEREQLVHPERVEAVARAVQVPQDETVDLGFPETLVIPEVVEESPAGSSGRTAERGGVRTRVFGVHHARPGFRDPEEARPSRPTGKPAEPISKAEPRIRPGGAPPPLPVHTGQPDVDRQAVEVQVEVVEPEVALAPLIEGDEPPAVAFAEPVFEKRPDLAQEVRSAVGALWRVCGSLGRRRELAQHLRCAVGALGLRLRRIDSFLRRIAGEENVILHNFLRFLAIAALLAIACVLAWMTF